MVAFTPVRLTGLARFAIAAMIVAAGPARGPVVRASTAWPFSSPTFSSPTFSSADPLIDKLAADHPEAHLIQALVTDIDHDGDLDIIASSTDRPVEVWINDGQGHFTRQTGRAPASMTDPSTPNLAQPHLRQFSVPPTPKRWAATFRVLGVLARPADRDEWSARVVRPRETSRSAGPARAPPVARS